MPQPMMTASYSTSVGACLPTASRTAATAWILNLRCLPAPLHLPWTQLCLCRSCQSRLAALSMLTRRPVKPSRYTSSFGSQDTKCSQAASSAPIDHTAGINSESHTNEDSAGPSMPIYKRQMRYEWQPGPVHALQYLTDGASILSKACCCCMWH